MKNWLLALLVVSASVSAWNYYYDVSAYSGYSNSQYYSYSTVAITPVYQQPAYQPYYAYYWQPVVYRVQPYWAYGTCWDARWGFGSWYCND